MKYQKRFNEINKHLLDVFGGTDGGVSYVKFRFLMEDMAIKADAGDDSAKRIIDVASSFSNLLKVSQKRPDSI